jgi:alpha-ketoglutarate-dependent 2,4-dichlorophenoxyacetate dioxygenase
MKLIPLHPEFGAVVTGLDLSLNLSSEAFEFIDSAINQYSVLVFRDQDLDDNNHIAFTRLFGELEEDHVAFYSHGKINYIGHVGNIDDADRKLENANRSVKSQTGNEMWHSDSSFREVPSIHSILFAYEVPEDGGDTEFASARAAYQRLDTESRNTIDSLVGIHDYIYSRTKVSEDAVTEGQRTFMRPVRQKLVRTNPVTGERNLFVGSHVRGIEGWPEQESRSLIDALTNETTRAESVYRHSWKPGDLVMWDNRCILHRGCGYDADQHRRRLHQTRVKGLGPTLAE